MKSFRSWLKRFKGNHSLYPKYPEIRFCDLADDDLDSLCDISESEGYKHRGCFTSKNTYDSWKSHLRLHGACDAALETLDDAWKVYEREVGNTRTCS